MTPRIRLPVAACPPASPSAAFHHGMPSCLCSAWWHALLPLRLRTVACPPASYHCFAWWHASLPPAMLCQAGQGVANNCCPGIASLNRWRLQLGVAASPLVNHHPVRCTFSPGEAAAAAWLPYVYAVAGHCQQHRRQAGKQHDTAVALMSQDG